MVSLWWCLLLHLSGAFPCASFNQSGGKWKNVRKILETIGTCKVEDNLEGVLLSTSISEAYFTLGQCTLGATRQAGV